MNLSDVSALVASRLERHDKSALAPVRLAERLELQASQVPDWWAPNGNLLFGEAGASPVSLTAHPGLPPPRNAIVIVNAGIAGPTAITLWGEGPLVVIGEGSHVPQARLACGGPSSIILGESLSWAPGATLNSRNGGLIYVGARALWSTQINVFTDDMHAILDAGTGKRINVYGGSVIVDEHVWLGFQALLLPGAHIGKDCVVGARSVVNSFLEQGSVCAGIPARVVRRGVTWSHEDIPPGE